MPVHREDVYQSVVLSFGVEMHRKPVSEFFNDRIGLPGAKEDKVGGHIVTRPYLSVGDNSREDHYPATHTGPVSRCRCLGAPCGKYVCRRVVSGTEDIDMASGHSCIERPLSSLLLGGKSGGEPFVHPACATQHE